MLEIYLFFKKHSHNISSPCCHPYHPLTIPSKMALTWYWPRDHHRLYNYITFNRTYSHTEQNPNEFTVGCAAW
jgi:hypothetical protein